MTGTLPGQSGGTGKSTWTLGSIPFATSGNNLTENNSRFFYDNTNHRLGLNTATPGYSLDIEDDGSTIGEMHIGAVNYAKFSFRASNAPSNLKAWQMYASPGGNFHFGKLNDAENFESTIFDVFTLEAFGQPYVNAYNFPQARMAFGTGSYPQAQVEIDTTNYTAAGSEVYDDGFGTIVCTNSDCLFSQQIGVGFVLGSNATGLFATVTSVSDDYNLTTNQAFAGNPGDGDTFSVFPNPIKIFNNYTGLNSLYATASGRMGISVSSGEPTAVLHVGAGSAQLAQIKMEYTGLLTTPEDGALEGSHSLHYTNHALVRSAIGGTTFDHSGDVGSVTTGETDLYSDSIVGNTFSFDNDKIHAVYAGTFVNSASTKRLRVYFGGTNIFDSTALTVSATASWEIEVNCMRDSSTTVKCSTKLNDTAASVTSEANYARVTGLTLSNGQILKITGQAAGGTAATNDVVAKFGYVEFKPSI